MNSRTLLVAAAVAAVVVLVGLPVAWMLWPTKPAGGGAGGDDGVVVASRPETGGNGGPVRVVNGVGQVYLNNFIAGRPGPEWSHDRVNTTPAGDRPYLGGFVTEPVSLELTKLPAHKLVRITFDLFLIKCWDGTNETYGNKIWDLSVAGGGTLIHATFCNAEFGDANHEQSFPDPFPSRPHPSFTGAVEQRTLGTMQTFGTNYTIDMSSVYHFVCTFPHNAPEVAFNMQATMKVNHDKSWGITNVQVETLSDYATYTEAELAEQWKLMGDATGIKAFNAQWELAAAPEQTTAYLAEHMKESIDATEAQMQEWVGQLGSSDKAVADDAMSNLIMQGKHAQAVVTKGGGVAAAWSGRLGTVMGLMARYPETATEQRLFRTRQLLGIIHTPEALKLMATIPAREEATTAPAEDL